MGLRKCPRCDLNYILDDGDLCTVCRKEVHGESEQDEIAELCSECGENPAAPGSELCASCLKEMTRHIEPEGEEEEILPPEDPNLELDDVSTMDEIAIDIGDEDMDGETFDKDDDAFKDDDDEDDDEEDDEETGDGDTLPDDDSIDDDDDLFDQ